MSTYIVFLNVTYYTGRHVEEEIKEIVFEMALHMTLLMLFSMTFIYYILQRREISRFFEQQTAIKKEQ